MNNPAPQQKPVSPSLRGQLGNLFVRFVRVDFFSKKRQASRPQLAPPATNGQQPCLVEPTKRDNLFKKIVKIYLSSFIATGIIIPLVATIITAEVYISSTAQNGSVSPSSIWNSLWLTFFAWLIIAVSYAYFVTPQGANMRSYSLLKNRLQELKAEVGKTDSSNFKDTKKTFYGKACSCCNTIHEELETNGMQWVLGKGYIRMWNLMHRADEALIEFEPDNEVIGDAMYSQVCINGSKMDNSQDLLDKLNAAMQDFDPDVITAGYFAGKSNATKTTATEETRKSRARAVMREVRIALNIFRDDKWEAMATSRNQLFATLGVAGLIIYLLLTIAVLNGVNHQNLIAAMVEYAVGAAAGLFNRLYIESGIDNAVDDYGLALSRIITTPVLSGLAGIGGVLITVILSSSLLVIPLPNGSSSPNSTPAPTASSAAQTGQSSNSFTNGIIVAITPTVANNNTTPTTTPTLPTTPTVPNTNVPRPCAEATKQSQGCYTLTDIFLLDPRFIVAAAVFGLTPNLLIQTLQTRATQYSSDILSSQPQNQGHPNT